MKHLSNNYRVSSNVVIQGLLYQIAIFVLLLPACKKEEIKSVELASFTVINAASSLSVKTDFTGKPDAFVNILNQIDFDNFYRFVAPVNQLVPVTVVSGADTKNVLFSEAFTFSAGDTYSLFLAGELGNVDTILVRENFPAYTDTTAGLRFVNCSPSGGVKIVPILVDYYGVITPLQAVNTLGYTEKTDFIAYPAPHSASYYMIELRDPVTDDLLTTVYLGAINSRNITLLIRGYVNGSPSLGIKQIYHKG